MACPYTAGTVELTALHASGYEHPATAVTIGVWSAASNHPLPILAVIVSAASALFVPAGVGVGVMNLRLAMLAVAV
jgi:hypothetical protein